MQRSTASRVGFLERRVCVALMNTWASLRIGRRGVKRHAHRARGLVRYTPAMNRSRREGVTIAFCHSRGFFWHASRYIRGGGAFRQTLAPQVHGTERKADGSPRWKMQRGPPMRKRGAHRVVTTVRCMGDRPDREDGRMADGSWRERTRHTARQSLWRRFER
jgi:hypothetical protein